MSITPKQYFEKIIRDFICGDIEILLNQQLQQAGPLLGSIVNGIDAMGGMIYGFDAGSAKRSVQFMVNEMGISDDMARIMYRVARCGLAHEGVPKPGMKFFAEYESVDGSQLLYGDKNGCLWLDVVGLARRYIDAVRKLETEKLKCVPTCPAPEANLVQRLSSSLPDISEYCKALGKARHETELKRYDIGEIDHMSSSSAVLPSHFSATHVPGTAS